MAITTNEKQQKEEENNKNRIDDESECCWKCIKRMWKLCLGRNCKSEHMLKRMWVQCSLNKNKKNIRCDKKVRAGGRSDFFLNVRNKISTYAGFFFRLLFSPFASRRLSDFVNYAKHALWTNKFALSWDWCLSVRFECERVCLCVCMFFCSFILLGQRVNLLCVDKYNIFPVCNFWFSRIAERSKLAATPVIYTLAWFICMDMQMYVNGHIEMKGDEWRKKMVRGNEKKKFDLKISIFIFIYKYALQTIKNNQIESQPVNFKRSGIFAALTWCCSIAVWEWSALVEIERNNNSNNNQTIWKPGGMMKSKYTRRRNEFLWRKKNEKTSKSKHTKPEPKRIYVFIENELRAVSSSLVKNER